MIGDREHTGRALDLGAIWMGHGVDLAQRMDALAGELELAGHHLAAELIRDVLTTDYNPLPAATPALGMPPLRPAVPPRTEPAA